MRPPSRSASAPSSPPHQQADFRRGAGHAGGPRCPGATSPRAPCPLRSNGRAQEAFSFLRRTSPGVTLWHVAAPSCPSFSRVPPAPYFSSLCESLPPPAPRAFLWLSGSRDRHKPPSQGVSPCDGRHLPQSPSDGSSFILLQIKGAEVSQGQSRAHTAQRGRGRTRSQVSPSPLHITCPSSAKPLPT